MADIKNEDNEVFEITAEEPSLAMQDHTHTFVDADYGAEDEE